MVEVTTTVTEETTVAVKVETMVVMMITADGFNRLGV